MTPSSPCTTGGARPRVVRRSGVFLGLAAVLALTGCDLPWSSAPTAKPPVIRPDELSEADGKPCPRMLPDGDDLGTDEPANESPSLLEAQKAWVCEYNSFDAATTSTGGTNFGWRRSGRPKPVPAGALTDLQDSLDHLEPADRSDGCNDDLGPRWLVVYSYEGDLTGVLVDDYGCRDVRLTDDPHRTPPGADDQVGTVGGILDGGPAILDSLGVGRHD
jgi:hypothetical protein